MDFAEYLRKSDVSEKSKVYMTGIVILVKVDEMYNILKSASNCLLMRWDGNEMRWKWMIKVFWLEIYPYIYYVPPVIRGRLHLVRDTTPEKEVVPAI